MMQEIMVTIFMFAFGAIIGSFFNVILLRKNTGESIMFGSSKCFSCGKKLGAFSMVPILSFIWQKRRCKECGTKISWQYPIVEILIGLLALTLYLYLSQTKFRSFFDLNLVWDLWLEWFFYFSAFATLFLLAVYDFKHKIIDRHFLYIFGFFSAIEFLIRKNFIADILSSFLIALFFYILWKISGGSWMGRGDTDIAFFISLFLGYPLNLMMLLVSFWLGGLVGVILLLLPKKRFGLKTEIPFGPFLASAGLIVWFFEAFFLGFYGIIF